MTDRERNVLQLAEKVMGWNVESVRGGGRVIAFCASGERYLTTCYADEAIPMWNPYESIADAWMLVEKLRAEWFTFNLGGFCGHWRAGFYCPFGPCERHNHTASDCGHGGEVECENVCEAICAAALVAVESGQQGPTSGTQPEASPTMMDKIL